jgi:hypothetical protein
MDKVPNNGPIVAAGDKVRSGLKYGGNRSYWIGKVTQVNAESNSMSVEFNEGLNPQKDVRISYPYIGPMATMRIVPEIGAMGFFVKSDYGMIHAGWLPPEPKSGPKYQALSAFPKEISDDDTEVTRRKAFRFREMRPGDVHLGSSNSADLFLDNDAELNDANGNTFRIRSGDGSAISTSQQNYMFANGVWRSAGFIQRNSLKTTQAGERLTDIDANKVVHSDGTESVYVGGSYEVGSEVFSEYRIEVEDSAELGNQINDVNELINITQRNPKAIFALGNWVGNDPNDVKTYGKFLAPDLYADEDYRKGYLNFKPLVNEGGVDAYRQKGIAYGFHVPGRSLLVADKEGKVHQYLGASTGAQAGRSLDLVATGGKWESWGKAADDGLSWKVALKGGEYKEVGISNNNETRNQIPRSSVLRTQGQVFHEFGAKTNLNRVNSFESIGNQLSRSEIQEYGYIRRVSGKERLETTGNRETVVDGDSKEKVRGQRVSQIGGSYVQSVIGDKTSIINSSYTLNVTQEIKNFASSRSEKLVLGSDEKQILLGNRSTDIAAGNYLTNIGAGSHNTNIGAGSQTSNIGTGNYSISVGTGNYGVAVGAGNVSIATGAGAITVAGTTTSIAAATSVDITSLLVNIGGSSMSGVLTSMNHPCFVTGAMSPGSFRVFATNFA